MTPMPPMPRSLQRAGLLTRGITRMRAVVAVSQVALPAGGGWGHQCTHRGAGRSGLCCPRRRLGPGGPHAVQEGAHQCS